MERDNTAGHDPAYRLGLGIMLLNDEGHVLVARRADLPNETWQMPQGGIDQGEAPCDAALRELAEEIGTNKAEIIAESKGWLSYDLPPDAMPAAWNGRWRGQRQKWFVMRFTGTDADIDLGTETPEFSAWKWVSVEQLPELVVSFKRQVYLDLVAEFSHLRDAPGRRVASLLADPIVRMTMAADKVSEAQLYAMLRKASRALRSRTPRGRVD